MGRHRPKRTAAKWIGLAVVAIIAAASTVILLVQARSDNAEPQRTTASSCPNDLRIVTSTSFAPVLSDLAADLGKGKDCVRIGVTVADGRDAAAALRDGGADVWIPDDPSWAATVDDTKLAEVGQAHAGTVIASSPIYMVTDKPTAAKIQRAGGTWLSLSRLLTRKSGVRLVLRDPAGSGDGMVAAGDVGEAVWKKDGMDASAMAMATALPNMRTVQSATPALPSKSGEVGLVPEYALLASVGAPDDNTVLLSGKDYTGLLRFAWLPTAVAAANPDRADALNLLYSALTGATADPALSSARLRRPDAGPPPGAPADKLPPLTAKPFDVLKPHHVDHVFATFYSQDRKTNLLIVVDVSGSMRSIAPGSNKRVIDVVREGCLTVGDLLPDQAYLGLWEFGSLLDPPRDYRTLLRSSPMTTTQRKALPGAVNKLDAIQTGTGLYDTILAAYKSVTASYRPGVPNQVLVFTDGRNEDDPGSITATQLAGQLQAASNKDRPVELTIAAFGALPEASVLEKATETVDGVVERATTADQAGAIFVHVAAGGLQRS